MNFNILHHSKEDFNIVYHPRMGGWGGAGGGGGGGGRGQFKPASLRKFSVGSFACKCVLKRFEYKVLENVIIFARRYAFNSFMTEAVII